MRRILVTSATGRLGAATVRRLAEGGSEVRAVSSRPREGAVEWVVADLTTGEGLAAAVEGQAGQGLQSGTRDDAGAAVGDDRLG